MSRLYGPDHHRRRSLRLNGYDYTQSGAYFVTVVVQGRSLLFGDVVGGKMRLNDAGEMVQRVWEEIPDRFPRVEVDSFVVMPNHIHGIIVLNKSVGAPLVGAPGTGCDGFDGSHGTDGADKSDRSCGSDTGATTRVAPVSDYGGTEIRIGKRGRSVQIIEHRGICEGCTRDELAPVRWTVVAAELL